MNPHKHAVPNIAFEILTAQPHDLRSTRCIAVGKQCHNILCLKLNQYGNDQSKADRNENRIAQRLYRPLRLFCPDVLSTKRRYGRQHGGRDEEQEANNFFHNPHGSRIIQSTPICNDRNYDKGYLNESILTGDRNANRQNFSHHRSFRLKILSSKYNAFL